MIDLIFMFILSSLTLLFLSLYVLQKRANKTLIAKTLETLLLQQLSRSTGKTDKEYADEAFLKFVSDSRDWAYQYIDEAQQGINKFITDVEPEIVYFDEYGIASSAYPHYHSMKKISGAYKELKKLLPDDYGKIDT
jgi:alpha-L-fucosidase